MDLSHGKGTDLASPHPSFVRYVAARHFIQVIAQLCSYADTRRQYAVLVPLYSWDFTSECFLSVCYSSILIRAQIGIRPL
ncbi:uncharacterized protein FOMMEDRAFT_22855 [Fomitiporia mediterranea MF3/22]|uniref:uncharacterized protein n=1 Tax=Fomitiporia mediterranea (strain MF3/22) TaxID=694068 RepID=UPI0004407DD6|nr:uncharacterized protein FOMMEDRAFT_22855 [Fomitiporia mediterranea MF3/22]EJC99778.1 hypothetical protein FOMMEDRAFT_22855 [Fomitiporia mediterranea MF3/22]